MTEIWSTERLTSLADWPAQAKRVEDEGWDGLAVTDTQNRQPETFACLGAAAVATERILLGVGVTNPVTRHPAVLASSAAAIQGLSGGRMVLSIGRGDSAAAHVGAAPISVRNFDRYVQALRKYLNGEGVDIKESHSFVAGTVPFIDKLGLASNPETSELEWLPPNYTPVPLEVAGSGPKVLGIAATYSDRPMVAVGAVPERVAWAMETVREARRSHGLDPDVKIGAYVSVVAHKDPAVARHLIRGVLASTSRFSSMQGIITGPADEASREVLANIRSRYSMGGHGTSGSAPAAAMTDEFANSYGIAGTGEECVRRLQQLVDVGVDKFVVFPISSNLDAAEVENARRVMASDVVPHFSRAAVAS